MFKNLQLWIFVIMVSLRRYTGYLERLLIILLTLAFVNGNSPNSVNDALLRDGELSTEEIFNENANNIYTLPPATPTPRNNTELEKPPKWLIYCSAIPTILIFIIALIIIAIKTACENDDMFDSDETEGFLKYTPSPEPKSKQKTKKKNDAIYDAMLEKFKEDKTKKNIIGRKKSSLIRIEGVGGKSPKSLAEKHILIGKLSRDEVHPDGNESALGQLVQLSTHTFIGSSIIQDMTEKDRFEDKKQLKNIIERSRENIAEVIKILPDDVNKELLPEDLEDAFRDFQYWEESLL